jgi:branched-chain amino acid transport system permease protein
VARALAADPVLIVLDEPAAGLRRLEKQALADLLRELRGSGLTMILVEHDMEFVMNLVDRIVVMDFGAKIAEGAPAEIRANPRVQEAYLGGVA